jgi:hypothetical protein
LPDCGGVVAGWLTGGSGFGVAVGAPPR